VHLEQFTGLGFREEGSRVSSPSLGDPVDRLDG
jgi:hypothetical protein